MESTAGLVIVAVLAVVALLFLVMKTKLQAFVALLTVSILVGLAVGMNPGDIITTIEDGMGGTLGYVAVIIGLGAMFGEILRVSGGAERLALTLIDKFGEKNISWALGLTGFIVSIPVFLDVALVILVPMLYSLTQRTKKSLLYFGIPLLAGLAVTHSFIPPTPGPIAVASLLGADLGWVILFGFLAGIPAMILAGPVFGKYISNKIHVGVPEYMLEQVKNVDYDQKNLPSFGSVVAIITLPLVLILINTLSGLVLPDDSTAQSILTFVGHPFVALTIAALLTFYIFGIKRGYSKEQVQEITTKALEPAGIIILVTGAGGVFGEMLIQSGIGDILANAMEQTQMPILVFAFLTATVVRVAQGSATVSMITAAGLVSPLLDTFDVSEPMLGLLVIAIASGATVVSHVNDSGFWLVNRYFGLTEKETLQSWTVMETIIGLVGFSVALILSIFV
ncbi:gluconate transporter [Halobacillus halophilus]|uniref:GntP family transporter (Probable substrate gluconate) n=1 Tax=Halobacillus halophilus (strain ATCC 35676 / DSM 2266 / JCM 20832 / KCTC 3685 / LMG 17431 / NBRC 102448 / NCIMB 2269) TaxID=866895 RepID=I0JIA6_HALH3|nr:gluconate:H+ symporter [Halobacillus halophilus]ASF38064.1 gluconate transporter [Halobacillus halophilus]CCG43874.1 GntP family transporter (probable substrate gluconate) [Halobacillus halophilus DSM 2266]